MRVSVISKRIEFRWRGDVTPRHFNVLFLCTGNSARSIMAEAILNKKGFPNFTGYSAGSNPTGRVHPEALKQIAGAGMPADGLRSKSWDEFARPDAPRMHFVFTVCDRPASEACPVWPEHPLTARWGVPDPAAVEGTREQVERAFFEAFRPEGDRSYRATVMEPSGLLPAA